MLAPVALRWNNPAGDDCLDLHNQPANHGWCNGYACMKRPGLIHPIVVTGVEYIMFINSDIGPCFNWPQTSKELIIISSITHFVCVQNGCFLSFLITVYFVSICLGDWHDIYLTSTPPQVMRFQLLNVDANDAVGIKWYNKQPQRKDVYYNGRSVLY